VQVRQVLVRHPRQISVFYPTEADFLTANPTISWRGAAQAEYHRRGMTPETSPANSRALRSRARRHSLRDEIVVAMQKAIVSGAYRPGQRLVERELGARFGVSSIPVREALQVLETQGLVARRPNYGCSVIQLEDEELARISELRMVLEPKVLEWASERLDDAARDRLAAQMEHLAAAAESGDPGEFLYQDFCFHRLLWEIAGNKYAARTLETVLGSLLACGLRRVGDLKDLDLTSLANEHRRMLEALWAHDGKAAAAILLQIAEAYRLPMDDRGFDSQARAAVR